MMTRLDKLDAFQMQFQFTDLENAALGLAALTCGIMAGFFWTYSVNVNRALMMVDGPTYAIVQSLLNENVRHPTFFTFFFGGAGSVALALFANWRRWHTVSFWLIAYAGIVYLIGVIVFTAEVHLPLNYYTESWASHSLPADWMEVRRRWNRANWIRVVASGLAFFLILTALILRAHRTEGPEDEPLGSTP